MRGVFVSDRLDMEAHFGDAFRTALPNDPMSIHGFAADPQTIVFAVAWHPPADGFTAYSGLRLIASIASGTDNIFACPSLPVGVPVIRMRDLGQASTASQFVLWHVLYWHRRFDLFQQQQREQRWSRLPQKSASETSVGVLGLGHIGARVATDLAANGFRTIGYRRSATTDTCNGMPVSTGVAGLEHLLGTSDIVVCALPLTPDTRGILNNATFSKMKRGSFLIHVGRGEQLIEADLLAALERGQISGASLDVFAVEPLPLGHPFWSHPQVIVTPHNASDVRPQVVAETVIAEMQRIVSGRRPINAVDPTLGY
jgi:glyoxylate/hydroxypyruvate reductase